MIKFVEFDFSKIPTGVHVTGRFDNTCRCRFSERAMDAIGRGQLTVHISQMGSAPLISDAVVEIASSFGKIVILIGSSASRVVFGDNTSGYFELRLWRNSAVEIKENTTSNGLRVFCDMSMVTIGADCMLSEGILVQSADQHGIVDLRSGKITNNRIRKVVVGEHVWLGRQCTLLPDISIGHGSVIGLGAIVTRDVPEFCIAVGVPAKVVKTGVTWSRSPTSLDRLSQSYIEQYRQDGSSLSE